MIQAQAKKKYNILHDGQKPCQYNDFIYGHTQFHTLLSWQLMIKVTSLLYKFTIDTTFFFMH